MTAISRPSRSRRQQRGFTLIEVLIAVLIFSVGVLGTVGMQARALQMSTQNQDRARASMLANEVVSQMWSQQTTTLPTGAGQWLPNWITRVATPAASGLPNGVGAVTVSATGVATISVTWRPTTAATSAPLNKFVTTVVLP